MKLGEVQKEIFTDLYIEGAKSFAEYLETAYGEFFEDSDIDILGCHEIWSQVVKEEAKKL